MASKCLSVLLAPGTGKASINFSLLAKLNLYSMVYILLLTVAYVVCPAGETGVVFIIYNNNK